MKQSSQSIVVKSHVARDLLQSAGLFKTDKLVVWEYVANGLQYIDSGISPIVKVRLDNKNKRITIADNGRGMDWPGLQNFFVMHGENIDRKAGRAGRGRFGTGKSAAFGIANVLRVTSIRNGKRSRVELSRHDIDAISSGDGIPVRTLEREVVTNERNGTYVEIEGVQLRSLDQAGIIHYIERHLAKWPKNVTVFVNHHQCEFNEPPIARQQKYSTEGEFRDMLGDIELLIKVSKTPLEEDLRGISIFSKGVWYETTLAGSEGREMAHYIFGEIDVPKLDEDTSPIAPFDMSRSMRLNPSNRLVQAIYAFVGQKVESVRRELVEADRKRTADEESRKLEKQASEIAQVINEDFSAFRERVIKTRAKADGSVDVSGAISGAGKDDDDLLFGKQVPADIVNPTGGPGSAGEGDSEGGKPRDLMPQVVPGSIESELKGRPAGGIGSKPKPHGGFLVQYKNMGEESPRAKYSGDERTIYINLDHPQFTAARGAGSIEDPLFRRLSYEVYLLSSARLS